MLESDKDPYKNAVRLYKMYRRANKFSNRVLDTPKRDGKPQDGKQPRNTPLPLMPGAIVPFAPPLHTNGQHHNVALSHEVLRDYLNLGAICV